VSATPGEPLLLLYNVCAGGLHYAKVHRYLWGRTLTDIHIVDEDHLLLVFRSKGERWRRWEEMRMRRILGEAA
jgi:hypothetical protein